MGLPGFFRYPGGPIRLSTLSRKYFYRMEKNKYFYNYVKQHSHYILFFYILYDKLQPKRNVINRLTMFIEAFMILK